MKSFNERIIERAQNLNSRVIVGLDPDIDKFPAPLLTKVKNNPHSQVVEEVIFSFNQTIIEATTDLAIAFKPQIAFYEQYGKGGMAALEETITYLRANKIPVILDAKRNDIDNTATAYARAWLSVDLPYAIPNPNKVDAITLNPYMGSDSVRPFLDIDSNVSVFLLAKTSNKSAPEIQDIKIDALGTTVADRVAQLAEEWGQEYLFQGGYSRVGLVVGATYPADAIRLRSIAPHAAFLMPGLGVQAGSFSSIALASRADGLGAYGSVSRGVLYQYNQEEFTMENWQSKLKSIAREKLNDIVLAIRYELSK